MKIVVVWDTDEQQAIRITYERFWKWEDFNEATAQLSALLDSVEHRVDVIIDVRNAGYPPPGAASRFKRVAETKHPNAGQIVFVALNVLAQFIKGILNLLKNIHWGGFRPPPYIFVGSLEEARLVLAQQRQQQNEKAEV